MLTLEPTELRRLIGPARSFGLVGNAPTATRWETGNRLEACDVIVRFNQARTTGYERAVGSRTDLLFANAHMGNLASDLPARELRPRAVVCLLTPRDARLDLAPFHRWAEGCPVFFSFAPDGVAPEIGPRGRSLTTGTYALQFLLWSFSVERLLLTGFTFFQGDGGEGHYWDPSPTPALTFHDPDREAEAAAAILSRFSGTLEMTPDTETRLNRKLALAKPGRRPLSRRIGSRLAQGILTLGLHLRRWGETPTVA